MEQWTLRHEADFQEGFVGQQCDQESSLHELESKRFQ